MSEHTEEPEVISSEEFLDWVKEHPESSPESILRKQYTADKVKVVGTESDRKIEFTISTNAKDRQGDVVSPKGWMLDNYKKNPVVLFAHDQRRPPIGRGLDVAIQGNKLIATAEFMDNEIDTSGFSDMIYRMLKGGFLKATSVGFLPTKWEMIKEAITNDDGESYTRITGIKFTEQELLEFSVVPIPANAQALMRARSKGIDIRPLEGWFEEALDNWATHKNCLLLPREEVEEIYSKSRNKSPISVFLDSLSASGLDIAKSYDDESNTIKLEISEVEDKTAITYSSAHSGGTPKADKGKSWDGPAQVSKATVQDLEIMCAWRAAKPKADLKKGDFKLPHHEASGSHDVVWRGVAAAMGSLLGARGGVKIPANERRSVYQHLARHYREFDEKPPSFKMVEDQVLKNPEYSMDYETGQVVKTEQIEDGDMTDVTNKEEQKKEKEVTNPGFGMEIGIGDVYLSFDAPTQEELVKMVGEYKDHIGEALKAELSRLKKASEEKPSAGEGGKEEKEASTHAKEQGNKDDDEETFTIDEVNQMVKEILAQEFERSQGKVK